MNFSLEIGPKTDLDTLPALKDVYITMLPGGDYKDTAEQAENIYFLCMPPIFQEIQKRIYYIEWLLNYYYEFCRWLVIYFFC